MKIEYSNRTSTLYQYDEATFRLLNLKTIRSTDNKVLQDLNYTYDPVGNITRIEDLAQQTVYFANQVIEPVSTFTYNALYRLTEATGRELLSLAQPGHLDLANNIPLPDTSQQAMQNYTQRYTYDELGNL